MDPYGLPLALLIAAAGVTADTARRWKRQGRIPHLAARLVRLWADGDLGALDRAWTGFTLRAGQLWTPYQFSVSPGEISAIPYRFAQLCALERELRTPAQWDLFSPASSPAMRRQLADPLYSLTLAAPASSDADRVELPPMAAGNAHDELERAVPDEAERAADPPAHLNEAADRRHHRARGAHFR